MIKLFNESIRSEYTRKVYTVCLNKFFEFVGSNYEIIECDSSTDIKEIEQHVIDFVIFLKNEGKGFAAIHNYVSAICKYYKINDVVLNTSKIHQFLPEFRKSKKDRGYDHPEIQRLLDIADERFRTIILLLASTGMRIGAIPSLRLRNIEKVSTGSGLAIYIITIYEGFKEEYITFTTPECSIAIDNYLNMRERYGEKLIQDSYMTREQFDVRDPSTISKCKETKGNTLTRKLIDLAERSGIRRKEVLEAGKNRATIRKDVPIAHGFRKFFTTQLVEADVKTELRWLLEGHNLKANDSHYIRTTEKRLQQEYEKAIDNLTIDPANRLQRKVETLTIEKSRLDKIEEKMRKIEKMYQ
jgi:integrase